MCAQAKHYSRNDDLEANNRWKSLVEIIHENDGAYFQSYGDRHK